MTAFDHEVDKPKAYELRLEREGKSLVVVSGSYYNEVKEVGNRMAKKLNRRDGLIITTPDGHELCRWV